VGICPTIPFPVALPSLTLTGNSTALITFSNLLDQPTGETTCSPPVPPDTQYEIGPMLPSTYGHNLLRTAALGRLVGSGICDSGLKSGHSCFSDSDCFAAGTPGTCSGGGNLLQTFGEFQGTPGACADSNNSSCNIDVTPLSICKPPSIVHTDHPLGFTDTFVPGLFCQGDPLSQNLPCTTSTQCKLSVQSMGSCSAGLVYYLAAAYTKAGPGGTVTHDQFDTSPALLTVAVTNDGTVDIPYIPGIYVDPAATNCP